MERLTENDRGTFLVTTKSGTQHVWNITDDEVTVQRQPKRGGAHHPSMDNFTSEPYVAEVHTWPEVDFFFLNVIKDGDVPWTRSARIVSIERLAV